MCLIGKAQLLHLQCRGVGPHLVARGKSHGFSRVAAGTWGSVEDRESFSSRDDMGCTEHSSICSTEIDDPLYLRRLSQGVSRGS